MARREGLEGRRPLTQRPRGQGSGRQGAGDGLRHALCPALGTLGFGSPEESPALRFSWPAGGHHPARPHTAPPSSSTTSCHLRKPRVRSPSIPRSQSSSVASAGGPSAPSAWRLPRPWWSIGGCPVDPWLCRRQWWKTGGAPWGVGVAGGVQEGCLQDASARPCCGRSGMVQLGAKAAGIPVWAGVTEEPSPAWSPALTAASSSVPAPRAPWLSTTVLPPAAASYVLQVRPLPPAPPQLPNRPCLTWG